MASITSIVAYGGTAAKWMDVSKAAQKANDGSHACGIPYKINL